ncbi:MAG: DUF1573 domain-containing protein [Muribaculaceae bacterium]|nr:DUF1573 domain-containing protein [Muribaculaceae bacterium]
MRRYLYIIVLMSVVMVTQAGEPMGHLTLLSGYAEMGAMDEGEVKNDTVLVVNTGTAPLVISAAFSACRCTRAVHPQEAIHPGDTASIVVTFDAGRRIPGQFRKIIRLRSNADNPVQAIIVRGHVKQPVQRSLSKYAR